MSVARDDFGYLSAIDALETSFLKTGIIEKKEEKKVSDSEKKEAEINDVYEKNSDYSFKEREKEIEKIQNDYNELEEKNQHLQKITSDLETIDKVIKKNQNSQENPEKDSESTKKREQALERISELMTGVREKQNQIAEMQREIQQTVNSVVELNIGENAVSIESEIKQAEALKQSIIDEVKKKPETVKKLQIKNIDRNLLLAMLSLRR